MVEQCICSSKNILNLAKNIIILLNKCIIVHLSICDKLSYINMFDNPQIYIDNVQYGKRMLFLYQNIA